MSRLIRTVTILTVSGTVIGAAATLGGIAASPISAGDAAIAACDGDGFGIDYVTSGGLVTSATVTGIADPGCEGGDLTLELTTAGAGVGGGGPVTVPSDGDTAPDSVAVGIAPQPPAHEIDGFSVSVVGP